MRIVRRIEWEIRRRRQARFMLDLRRRGIVPDGSVRVVYSADLDPETPIFIDRGSTVHRRCVLKGFSPITIGRYCEVAEGVHIVSSNHAVRYASTNIDLQRRIGAIDLPETRGPVEVGHNVWIGDNAVILSGVRVGNGAAIGAGSVVTRDVEPFAIVGGVPARQIRKRFPGDVIAALEGLAWWDWPETKMRARRELFERDLEADGSGEFLRGLLAQDQSG